MKPILILTDKKMDAKHMKTRSLSFCRPSFCRLILTALLLAPLAALAAADASSRLKPPQHLGPPLPEHAVTNRALTMAPSIAVAPKGRLWGTFYAGVTPGEDHNNYVVLSTSGDNGATW